MNKRRRGRGRRTGRGRGRACLKKNSSLHILAEDFWTPFFSISAKNCSCYL